MAQWSALSTPVPHDDDHDRNNHPGLASSPLIAVCVLITSSTNTGGRSTLPLGPGTSQFEVNPSVTVNPITHTVPHSIVCVLVRANETATGAHRT